MPPTLTYNTPIWKEVILALASVTFIAFGAAVFYAGYDSGNWIAYGIGSVTVLGGIYALIIEVTSRKVLSLDAEGVYVHPHVLSKKLRVSWHEVDRFEKSVQTLQHTDRLGSVSTQHMTYLGIYLKRPQESAAAGFAYEAALRVGRGVARDRIAEEQIRGNIFLLAFRLPKPIDMVLKEVRTYHEQITGGAVTYPDEPPPPTPKNSFKPSPVAWLLFVAGAAIFSLIFVHLVTGMTVEQVINWIGSLFGA